MSTTRRPSSLDGIKRLAKSLKSELGMTHGEALNLSARRAGYQSFTHARHELEAKTSMPTRGFPPRPKGGPKVGHYEYLERCRDAWVQTLAVLNPEQEDRRIWTRSADIRLVLQQTLEHTRSHTHLPTGGGLDFEGVKASRERGVLEFESEPGSVHMARPKRLILEWIERRPAESFLLLELAELEPTGVYDLDEDEDDEEPDDDWMNRREEIVRLGPDDYEVRSIWDQGFLGYDHDGAERPLPKDATLVTRWFDGKMLVVSKGSMWNGTSGTYDGRHDSMSADQIRAMIERALPKVAAE